MKLFEINFEPMWPVPCGCIILAEDEKEALKMAKEVITHTKISAEDITEYDMTKSKVVFYESGDY